MSGRAESFRLAVLQLEVTADKQKNIANALEKIREAVTDGRAQVVILPECFNSPYGVEYFAKYAEIIPSGETSQNLSAIAKELAIYLIGGSIPERDEKSNKLYNTCTIWNPDGTLQTFHRKMHLYDVDLPTDITFNESSVLTPGNRLTVATIFDRKVGINICHDIRFEEMAKLYRKKGCEMLVYPSAFDLKTGEMHWELLARSRANDNQLYVVQCSVARDTSAGYVAWGYSMVVDPWGTVIKKAGQDQETLFVDIDFKVTETVRRQIPIYRQRRIDIYETTENRQ
jgi:omega-amidase